MLAFRSWNGGNCSVVSISSVCPGVVEPGSTVSTAAFSTVAVKFAKLPCDDG